MSVALQAGVAAKARASVISVILTNWEGGMRRILALAALVMASSFTFAFACSSTDSTGESPDAAVDAEPDRRSPPKDAGMDEVAPVCAPQPTTRPSKYVPPRPWHQPACEPAQVKGFMDSCYFGGEAVCQAFIKQNPACAACAHSREGDATWGALVIYDGNYFNANVPGCVANALGDLSAGGCGAAMARLIDCASQACRSCLPIADQAGYDRFDACWDEKEVGTICAEDIARYNVKCAGHTKPEPADPTYLCYGVGLPSDEAYYESYVSMFCTPETDGGLDGGADASDAVLD